MRSGHLFIVFLSILARWNDVVAAALCGTSDANKTCSGRVKCPSCLTVTWVSREPYVFLENNTVKGLLPEILKFGVSKCCGSHTPSCWTISHGQPKNLTEDTFLVTSQSHIVYPIIVDTNNDANTKKSVIGLLPSTGIAFVAPKGERRSLPGKLLESVLDAWPVLIVMFLLAILAGILVWAMDTRTNPDHFPPTFFKGTWEGFWWAFVSMTTVGYGDRAPQSLLGRFFAVVWILLGICIISIFTATLTTSLTAISLDTTKSLPGTKVAVLKDSIEAVVGVKEQARLVVYDSVKEIKRAMESDEVEGALLDTYLVSHNKDLFAGEKYKVHKVVKEDTLSYGAVVNDTELATCLSYLLARDKYSMYEVIKRELKDTLQGDSQDAVKNSQSIFDPTGDLFYPSLYTCLALVIIILIVGGIFEFLYRKKKIRNTFSLWRRSRNKRDYDRNNEIPMSSNESEKAVNGSYNVFKSAESLDQLEQQMLAEVKELFQSWRNRLNKKAGMEPEEA